METKSSRPSRSFQIKTLDYRHLQQIVNLKHIPNNKFDESNPGDISIPRSYAIQFPRMG